MAFSKLRPAVLTQLLVTPIPPQTAGEITLHNVTKLFRALTAWGRPRASQGNPMEVPGEEDGTREPGKRRTQFFPLRGEEARVIKWLRHPPGESGTWTPVPGSRLQMFQIPAWTDNGFQCLDK